MATTIKNTVKLKKDEVFSLPAGAKVTSLIGGATSSCTTLPTAETLVCVYFQWEFEGDDGGNDAWENSTVVELNVNGVVTPLNTTGNYVDTVSMDKIVKSLTDTGFFYDVVPFQFSEENMVKVHTSAKTFSSMVDNAYFVVQSSNQTGVWSGTRIRVYPILITDYNPTNCTV
jgi:hypothetical protein